VRAEQLIVLAAAVLAARGVRAEPYLMVRTGAKCSACHTNQTGGGKRTAFAHIHAHDIEHDLDLLPIPPGVKPFNGEINQYLSIGSDLRVRHTTVFEDEPNAQGEVPSNKAFRRHVQSNTFDVQEFLFYGQIDLFPDIVTTYVDEDFTSGATNREALAMLHGILPWDSYFKGGRLFPAYGLRIQDDQAFIRQNVGYTFQNPEEGVELGTQPGPLFVASSITNTSSSNNDVAATINAYAVFEDVPVVRNLVAGGSFARQSNKRWVGGVYGGANWWHFTYLGEFDEISDRSPTSPTFNDNWASYLELDYLAFDWLNLKGTFEFLNVSGDANQTRWTIGANPFINRVIQPIIEYRINNGPTCVTGPCAPTYPASFNQPELWVELHLFL